MERRDWSLKALDRLIYVDSHDDDTRASLLLNWCNEYLDDNFLDKLHLDTDDLKKFHELFYKNINFLKEHTESIRKELNITKDLRKFYQ